MAISRGRQRLVVAVTRRPPRLAPSRNHQPAQCGPRWLRRCSARRCFAAKPESLVSTTNIPSAACPRRNVMDANARHLPWPRVVALLDREKTHETEWDHGPDPSFVTGRTLITSFLLWSPLHCIQQLSCFLAWMALACTTRCGGSPASKYSACPVWL